MDPLVVTGCVCERSGNISRLGPSYKHVIIASNCYSNGHSAVAYVVISSSMLFIIYPFKLPKVPYPNCSKSIFSRLIAARCTSMLTFGNRDSVHTMPEQTCDDLPAPFQCDDLYLSRSKVIIIS